MLRRSVTSDLAEHRNGAGGDEEHQLNFIDTPGYTDFVGKGKVSCVLRIWPFSLWMRLPA